MVEALAAGVPVVASDVAPCREVLQDGAWGALAKPGDAEELARHLGTVLSRKPIVPSLAEVASRFDTRTIADAYWRALMV